MKKYYVAGGVTVSMAAIAVLFAACGGDGGGGSSSAESLYSGSTSMASMTVAGVNDTIDDITASGVDTYGCTSSIVPTKSVSLFNLSSEGARALETPLKAMLMVTGLAGGKSMAMLDSTPPTADDGECGGHLTYPTWSHSNGNTSIKIVFDEYCNINDAGNREIITGSLTAYDDGTPSSSGPITTKFTADIPGITITEKNASGTVVLSQSQVALSGLEFVPTVSAVDDESLGGYKVGAMVIKDLSNNLAYMVKDVTMTTAASGAATQLSFNGTACKSTAGCSTINTDTPVVMDDDGFQSGVISFTGASNQKTLLTVVPGIGQNFTVTVNGSTLTQLNCNNDE